MPPPPPILDYRKWISIAFLAISDQYATFCFNFFFTKWLAAAILDDRKSLSIAFLAISDQYVTFFFDFFFTKWLPAAILDDRKSLSIAFLAISDQYATVFFCSQNGCRRPFWMTENHFRSHFSPFQINMKLFLFWFFFSQNGCRRAFWMTENHFWSHFSPFQINMQLFFHKMAASDHFGWPKITFDRISRDFRSIRNFYFIFFHKMAAGGHFRWPKITFDRISRHFRSIHNFFFFTKWLSAAILDDRKSLFIAFLAIFRSICNFDFFSQNGCWRPFWMTENRFRSHFSPFQINTQLRFFLKFTKWLPATIWITENHIQMHFTPFQINMQLFVLNIFSKWPPAAILEVRFAPKTIGFFHYVSSMTMPNMKLIGEFMTQLEMPHAFWTFLYKMAARGHFVFPIDATNHRVLVISDLNGYGEYEFDRCICDKVMVCTSVGVRRRRPRRRRNQKHNITEIFKFRGYNNYPRI